MAELTELLQETEGLVAYPDKQTLPSSSGIYFVTDMESVLYIGQSVNIRNRWCTNGSHHAAKHIENLQDCHIGYFSVADERSLDEEEARLIEKFNPPYNIQHIQNSKVEFIGFKVSAAEKEKIRTMCDADGSPVSAWVRDAVLSKASGGVQIKEGAFYQLTSYLAARKAKANDEEAWAILKGLF